MLNPEFLAKLAAMRAKTQIPPNVTPQIVDDIGLSEDHLGDRFPQELVARREWIAENCYGRVEIEPIRDTQMRLVGRQFKFEDVVDAVFFNLRWAGDIR
ncbi:hypothetical protein JKG68_07425 [Microvirga aerilata]|uniref:Uncharacterized protein n=1 Tax=Microvirga aerilata TaxID=670292 RepID=A0A936ZBU0_9HYPH|nr:hypothetical protein [Microvirga aerilata]MBL0403789.1 hypothetical protein [Microvirga aerilata]